MASARDIIKIEIDRSDLWILLIEEMSDHAGWPECFKWGIGANKIIDRLKKLQKKREKYYATNKTNQQ